MGGTMAKTEWEEEVVMNGELREAFDDIKRENKEEHAKTRLIVRDLETRLNCHLIESAVSRARLEEHLEEHKAERRWKWALNAGVIVALIGAAAACATRFIR